MRSLANGNTYDGGDLASTPEREQQKDVMLFCGTGNAVFLFTAQLVRSAG